MGKPMVKNLIKAGYPVIAYDINQEVLAEVEQDGVEKGESYVHVEDLPAGAAALS